MEVTIKKMIQNQRKTNIFSIMILRDSKQTLFFTTTPPPLPKVRQTQEVSLSRNK